ncbi:hypothetical protein [Nocardia sp. NBC_01327]|uniref:hypothetical protein n=1 Tax=Nocardia sp. NBC_01327 TaxID=2903593 RepID=UPI002E12CD1E|nr:hypothetical protein OG326_06685 [Nocardia sp. NBC_01327]
MRDRLALLDEGNRLHTLYRKVGYTPEGKDAIYRVFDLQDEYRRQLPEVIVARCPFTDAVVRWPLDTVDLDGWYWDWDQPIRRHVAGLPFSWLTMEGAVRLAEPVTAAPFHAMPGPAAPYVVPRLLEDPEVRAVLSQAPIGRHTGWAITYFGNKRPEDIALENVWGSRTNEIHDPRGLERDSSEHVPKPSEHDFDLRPWLEAGRLLWIAPGDTDAALREGTAECPYLDIEGDHREQLINRGEIIRY